MFGANGNNNQNNKNNGAISAVIEAKAKAIKKKILIALLPCLGYLLIGILFFLGVLVVFSAFNNMFSLLTGKDPYAIGLETDAEGNTVPTKETYTDVNGEDRIPGYEDANAIFATYGSSDVEAGLNALVSCEDESSLLLWLKKKFSNNFQTSCQLVKFIQETALKKEKDYNKKHSKDKGDYFYLDRGLIVSTLFYSYVYRGEDEEKEVVADRGLYVSASDPLTIINQIIDNPDVVKFDKDTVEEAYDAQVLEEKYLAQNWEVIYKVVNGHMEPIPNCDSSKSSCEKFVEDFTENYYGCTYKTTTDYELDLDKYRIYLRDKREEIIGKAASTVHGANVPSKNVFEDAEGYVGAKNYDKTVEAAQSYCRSGNPVFADQYSYALTPDIDEPPCHDDVCHTSKTSKPYHYYYESQAFIKDIVDRGLNNYQVFLTHADYDTQNQDNLSFTYDGKNYKIDYTEGFVYKNFSYTSDESHTSHRDKMIEFVIDTIFNNSESMNQSMNFPYTPATTIGSFAGNLPYVSGDEAAPLGDFKWVPSSDFGWRGAISGTTHTGVNLHTGLDMTGTSENPINQKAIYAWKPGLVIGAGDGGSCGNFVKILHESDGGNKVESLYCHMYTTPSVKVGDKVAAGTQIGLVGSTGNSSGPHLHFEVQVNGSSVHPCYYLNVGRTCKEANTNGIIKNWEG